MLVESGSRFVLIGDSITDADRTTHAGPYGNGYVLQLHTLLHSLYPERRIHVINRGISGDKAPNLKARWQTDVFDVRPDWVSIMIGINDVWRQFDHPQEPERHCLLEEYRAILDDLVQQTLPCVKGLVLMTPYYIELNRQEPMRQLMDQYGDAVRRLAEKHGTLFVDVQAAFDRMMTSVPSQFLAGDRVHPNSIGHMTITRALLKTLQFEWK